MNRHTLTLAIACSIAFLSALAVPPPGKEQPKQDIPKIAPASDEGERAIPGFKIPEGLKMQLWAAEPMLANPVAFTFDERGRVFVAESFRQEKGIEDDRAHKEWLEDDIASRTVEDRLAMYKKFYGDKMDKFTREEDRISLLEDRAGKGKADTATVFAGGFNDALDGTGASVLARGNSVYYTCIPNVWLLQDTKGTGKADVRTKLSTGWGVHVALRGHDMHGLRLGPDGKIYFSIGDRGFHVVTKEGKTLDLPDTGAALRCNPDGSELEIFATGLRNPQQFVFDKYGNLWTGDNNSDAGDKARWTYVVEGGDTGWRMSYQYVGDRGPWNREGVWHLNEPGHPAWNIPPVAHIGDGPSGVAYNPGTGLNEKYRDCFFMSDFRGGPGNSLVHLIHVEPDGAGFKAKAEPFIKNILTTDVCFGPDGALYISDWVQGWIGVGKGRIYKLSDPARANDPLVAETRKLLAEGMGKRSTAELVKLLGHADMRVRQEAQFALAAKGESSAFAGVASAVGQPQLARIHAIWGIGQIGRKLPNALAPLPALLADKDDEIRAQAAKILGEDRVTTAAAKLVPLLRDANLRVRYFAALSLGKLGHKAAFEPVVEMLRENADKDVFLRHGGVMALAGISDTAQLLAKAGDSSASVRLAALLTLRRMHRPEVAKFLADSDPFIVLEAARAINDVPINDAMPALAGMITHKDLRDPKLLLRVVNAHFRLGKSENAKAIATLAADTTAPEPSRLDALDALKDWGSPSGRDRVMNLWRPLPDRPPTDAIAAAAPILPAIIRTSSPKLQKAAADFAGEQKIAQAGDALFELATNAKGDAPARIEALHALSQIPNSRVADAVRAAITDKDPRVRTEGVQTLAARDPGAAVKLLGTVLDTGTLVEKQGAMAALGSIKQAEADTILSAWLDKLLAGKASAEIQLDLLDAARKRKNDGIKAKLARYQATIPSNDKVAPYREALAGGNAEAGGKIFFEKVEASCIKCHKINGNGSDVGPDLSHIGSRSDRHYILESIIDPNAQIAPGYQMVSVELQDDVYTGRLLKEDPTSVKLEIYNPDGTTKQVTVLKNQIKSRRGEPSAMPEGFKDLLKKTELRDLVEFLAAQK
jgi:quinoprotein glucose dehydrogenase